MKSTAGAVDEIPQYLRYEMRRCRMKYPPAGGYEIRRWRGVCFVGISCRQSKRGTALEKQCLAQLTTYEIFITPQAFYCKAVLLISYEFL